MRSRSWSTCTTLIPQSHKPEELRSELVTVLDDGSPDPPIVVGFLGGTEHDGTFRLRRAAGHVDGFELWGEAYFGGAVVERGVVRRLHSIESWQVDDDVRRPLDWWAAAIGAAARVSAPYQVGWCSWYHYFENVTQQAFESNLELAADWPFEVFQLDDGFQPAIGDWLSTNDKFDVVPRPARGARHRRGIRRRACGSPRSSPHRRRQWRPDIRVGWRHMPSGRELVGMVNDHWGGAVHTLDTTQPEVLDHLEHVARELVAAGFRYLKLDFTYAPGLAGRFADPTQTPAERVRGGFDAIRRGAGEDVFILGCGAPLGACIGAVDGMRIGPDVAPWWEPPAESWSPPGYRATSPATSHALAATRSRQFMHRRLWLNDPDCVMLRTTETAMTADEASGWAAAVGESGGMALVSDDLALLGVGERALLDEVIALGRANDAPFGG